MFIDEVIRLTFKKDLAIKIHNKKQYNTLKQLLEDKGAIEINYKKFVCPCYIYVEYSYCSITKNVYYYILNCQNVMYRNSIDYSEIEFKL